MQVAIYARVSTLNQQQEGTLASQVQLLKEHIQQQSWSLLPEHEFLDEGVSGTRLDRPALDRLRDCAQRGEFDAIVLLSPDRLAREDAHQWLLVEEFEKLKMQLIFLQNPFGDTPQGKLLTQMQGMIAEYERAQIVERTRRGRLEKARRGAFIPWAYACYGYRYLAKRHGGAPQVMFEPAEAEVVRGIYRAAVEEQLSCRQITKRLNESKTPTPSGKNQVWHANVVRNILTNRVYAGVARYNYRQPVLPKYRKTDEQQLRYLKTGRSYRPETDWVLSQAPAIISLETFDKAQLQLQRNREVARKMYQPASRRYLLRTLVKCGECSLGMVAIRQLSKCKKYEYLYYECNGHHPLTVGRASKCNSKRARAERLDGVVWQALSQLLGKPDVIPQWHQTWAEAKQQNNSSVEAQQAQLIGRSQRIERQNQRLLDAYQAETINLSELQTRRQKLAGELQQIEQELRQLASTRQQSLHWQQVIDNAESFHRLLGANLERLSFAERQAVTQCLINKVIVTGEEVDIHFVLPFESAPQVINRPAKEPEGAPGHFYRLRLAHLHQPSGSILQRHFQRLLKTRHLGVAQQNPFQRLDSDRRIGFPDADHRAQDGGQFAHAVRGTVGRAQAHAAGTQAQARRPCRLSRPGAQFQVAFSQTLLLTRRRKEVPRSSARLINQGTILRRTHHEPVPLLLTTDQELKDVSATIANPSPADGGILRRGSDPCRGRLPDLRFARAAQACFACFALRRRLAHQRLLVGDAEHFHWRTTPRLIRRERIRPAHGQRGMQLKALFSRIPIAYLPQSRTLLFPAPGRFGRVFDQQIEPRLMEPFHRSFTMSSLQLVRCDLRIGKERIGCLNLVPATKGLRNAFARVGRKTRRRRDRPLITLGVPQFQVPKILFGPRLWVEVARVHNHSASSKVISNSPKEISSFKACQGS